MGAAQCVAAIIHCIASTEERDEMVVALLDIDDDDDDWRSIEYDLNSLAFLVGDASVYQQAVHEAYAADIESTFLSFLSESDQSKQVLVQIAALRIGYNFVARLANFDFLSMDARRRQIIALLDQHLLPLLSAKVNNNNEDIVISSIEFLLDGLLQNDNQNEEEEEKEENDEKNDANAKKELAEFWRLPEVHQVIIPYLIENHLNNIQPELMRKCITTLLQIDATSSYDLRYYNVFIKGCNQKNVVKELKTIVDALTKIANN